MYSEWNFSPEVIAKAQEIGIGSRVAIHWSEAECQDQEGTVIGVEIHRHGKVEYAVHIDGDISPTDGFTHDLAGNLGGTIRILPSPVMAPASFRSTAEDKLDEAKKILELIAFEGKPDREEITANAVDYLASGGRHPNHGTLAAAFLAGLEPVPLHEQLARALMTAKAVSNAETESPSAPRLPDGWQQLLSAHVHKLELACMVDGGSVTWNQEGCRAMAFLLRRIGEKLDIALERELAGELDPPTISEAYVEAVVKAVTDVLEDRARYFDGTTGHFDRADAARSYRASAKEVATALRRALVSNAGQLKLELHSGDVALDWISSNCPALRKDNGDLLYRLPQMVKAFQAGVAEGAHTGGAK